MNRRLVLVILAALVALTGGLGYRLTRTKAQQVARTVTTPNGNGAAPRAPAPALPVGQVILFNSGVAYFQREGEVEESTRVDLSFPAADVNDLLKSLVLQDLGGGRIAAVSYDSHDPIDKTLKSFALDLTGNPTFGQILNQARGEKVEVTMQPTYNGQTGPLTGAIVGMESQPQPAGKDVVESHLLNLLCADGMRSVPLSQVMRLRFLNATLEGEFRRALEVLASSHDTEKKMVSLTFNGQGKRPVRVGYVVENPIWKTNYRLVLGKDGHPHLQGWAIVENTSDDDWNNVRMVLVSGRPISFQMDQYQPLYIPRPTVEPELFASLRPPTYNGALVNPAQQLPQVNVVQGQGFGTGGAMGGFGAGGAMGGGMGQNFTNSANPFFNRYQMNLNGTGLQGGQFGQAGNLGGQAGLQGGNSMNFNNDRLSFDELQRRRQQQEAARSQARAVGSQLALDPSKSIASVASAEEIGDSFQYTIDHPVSLPRQKSALLPIVNDPVEATRVSIYNETVHAKFPLLGLRFKNTSGFNLMQGPVTVYEAGSYAGDARIMDLQPNEERLLSYAIDLGTEVKAESHDAPQQLTAVKVVKGILLATHKLRETRTYLVKNRSDHDRVLLIEHPFRAEWRLVTPEKAAERTREVYRFQLKVPAGQSAEQGVVEEQTQQQQVALLGTDDRTVRLFLNSKVSSESLKQALQKALEYRSRVADTQRERTQLEGQLKAITEDQSRLRANFEKLPPTSAAYKRYLEKFDTQETEIEKLQDQIKKLQLAEKQQQQQYEDFLAGLSVE